MKKFFIFIFFVCLLGATPARAAGTISLSVSLASSSANGSVMQGEPIFFTITGAKKLDEIKSLYFGSDKLNPFLYKSEVRALYGVDLNKKAGEYTAVLTLSNGEKIEKKITVLAREKKEAPLGIPEKLGGDTKQSATTLVDTLAQENKELASLTTGLKSFWTEKFIFPVKNPIVTDEYGYARLTGGYSISHKGTDFKASEGTPVLAMNRGVVRRAHLYRDYGKTVVLDHGLGLMSMYMHLSKIYVSEGELVLPGQVIGLSGKTGYAESSHLHLSIRINNTSIDPMKFMQFFK